MSFNRDTPIAFLGMGLMGSRMAARLIHAGFQVAVWNRTASACAPLLDTGAKALDLEQLGRYKIILTCLADDQAVQQVFNQIQPYLKPGQTIVDFSSLSVDKTLELAQAARRQHVNWIDSPVSGGTAGAEQGTLVIFAGGNAEKIQDLTLVYNVLSQRVTRMGETGTGQATKICNQLIVAANSILIAEAVALAEQAGVDTRLLAPALAGGFADSKPFQILAPRMATHVFEPVQWKVQTLSKDLGNAVKLAEQFKLDIPVAKQALTQLTSHQQNGFAEKDLATVIQQVKS
ncbi:MULTISPECIES: NAD(P)-dependent oxidoreductase [Acinetobacter]|jgi:3-hydroxyisobutyrate dehydrogenase|uniref:NAD(P)-dependent oxidoreductase n=1 Tax=Acinetobacter TaxID=469 RepID=UPI000277BF73|nr:MULTISPECIES: NAD(P)-dependent oxidoreductase [Acinetobacter]EJO35963.1 phosphogluconate dehydrogenase (decarboxylating), NAD binding domain protein [Acinetobacter radioresistens WC-A-157]EXF58632.1 NAD binding domain of 6-phosphogluconate dehydrogenase family protein [Acinetobacter sp. 1294596]MCX0332694.1 NAD(P)-dependent oxidoreductase [Acinetobacter radioresistens]HAD68867.1 NAD(P)-dependent oxidoreductase [Acinetobacter radioresistens]